jgi:hypothetical protein
MAKYTRFDSRNKKRNKHKDQYLDRFQAKAAERQKRQGQLDEEDLSTDVKQLCKKYM